MYLNDKTKTIVDNCRFCWMCRHVCPIGNATGQERNTARGRALSVSLLVRGAATPLDVAENVYECALCGACTNNCMTGWDPRVFVQELKPELLMGGAAPDFVTRLLENEQKTGNVWGEQDARPDALFSAEGDTLLFMGQYAALRCPDATENALALLQKAGVRPALTRGQDSGAALWFLTGKTAETKERAVACAKAINHYATVVVYDPVDLSLMLHEYKEWGIAVTAKIVGFNEYLLSLIGAGKLRPGKSDRVYTPQDHYAYARELEDTETLRRLIETVGTTREMLLHGKEANMAGHAVMEAYMPAVIARAAQNRWQEARRMGLDTLVTENPAEHRALSAACPAGCRVLSVEQMLMENML